MEKSKMVCFKRGESRKKDRIKMRRSEDGRSKGIQIFRICNKE